MKRPAYAIRTYGCEMNKNDSERLSGLLESVGLERAVSEDQADMIILNTCSVREHAEQRIMGLMEGYLERHKAGEKLLIAVTGCMAGRDKDGSLRKRLKCVDLFFATPDMIHLPRWIAELRPDWQIQGDVAEDYLKINPLRNPESRAFVTIQTGCNQFCTYCVVPYARGLERNRPLNDILREVRGLATHGIKEITLLGQTVNSYTANDPEWFSTTNPYQSHFAALLWELNQIPGIERIHWTSPHPLKMDDQVIHALSLPKQLNYIHLPVQSGSNEILRRMNRKYTREQYLEIIQKIRSARPSMAIGTDIIVGFSGETDKDFQDTLDLYTAVDFDICYTAQYSVRSGTLGQRLFKDDVPSEVKKQRWLAVQELMEKTTLKKNQVFVGQTLSVLVDHVDGKTLFGTSSEFKQVRATGAQDDMLGKIMPVRINRVMTWQLVGEVVAQQTPVL